ncbi:Arm DNA-binding domain-containing protein [Pseudomonas sp. BN515]|uniref:Arm DNA-binding domain-containing protein n=1 Tax=Pseudomonas sp. BN515 TaxID=2567892 RepID=UPI0024556EC1|nr:Arm DNA-binding domain-containing protein [Pseudomonas sp. BN515]
MKTKFSLKLLNGLKPADKPYRVHDTSQPGLFIRVLPSGHMSYMVTGAQNKNVTLGRVGKMTLDQARQEATCYLAEAHEHRDPLAIAQGRTAATSPTLRDFIDDTYLPWFIAHHRGHEKTTHPVDLLRANHDHAPGGRR